MGRAARAEHEAMYTAERNHTLLVEVYRRALAAISTEAQVKVA